MDFSDVKIVDPLLAKEARQLLNLLKDSAAEENIRNVVRTLLEDVLTCYPANPDAPEPKPRFCGTKKLVDDMNVIELVIGSSYDQEEQVKQTLESMRNAVWRHCGTGNTRTLIALATSRNTVNKESAADLVEHMQELRLFLELSPDGSLPSGHERQGMISMIVEVLSKRAAQADTLIRKNMKGVKFTDDEHIKRRGQFYDPSESLELLTHVLEALEEGVAIVRLMEKTPGSFKKQTKNLEAWMSTLKSLSRKLAT